MRAATPPPSRSQNDVLFPSPGADAPLPLPEQQQVNERALSETGRLLDEDEARPTELCERLRLGSVYSAPPPGVRGRPSRSAAPA